jgi:hypothetical protein
MNTNFFSSVDKHNIERFHSECISWIFDNYNNIAIKFISSITKEEDIKIISVKTEEDYIDIEIDYKCNSSEKKLIIENKIKSTEHFINGFSQTEYYYNEFNKKKFDIKNMNFVYLTKFILDKEEIASSHSISLKDLDRMGYNFDKQNIWRQEVPNPWITVSYEKLYKLLEENKPIGNSSSDIILKEYINYIREWTYVSRNYLNFSKENKIDTQGFNYLYFKLLFNLLISKIKAENQFEIINYYPYPEDRESKYIESNSTFFYFKASSANSSNPLFAFFKRIKINENDKNLFKNVKDNKDVTTEYLNIGIQVQGDVVKYYTSIDDKFYDYVTTINNIDYMKYCDKYFDDITLKNISPNFKSEKPNNCKTKTFYSRSFKIKDFVENDIQNNTNFIYEIIVKFLKINY